MATDKKKLTVESNRGAHAAALLDNALFREGFEGINRSIWFALQKVNVHDREDITALLALQKANRKLFEYYEQIARTGQMADIQLRTENARTENQ
jgi:hypothetical protein